MKEHTNHKNIFNISIIRRSIARRDVKKAAAKETE